MSFLTSDLSSKESERERMLKLECAELFAFHSRGRNDRFEWIQQ
jgi:hypothetical protein